MVRARALPRGLGVAGEPLTLALLAAAVLVTAAVRLLARRFPGVDVPLLARTAPFMPFAVRLHLTVSLVGLLSLGFYLSPAMDLEPDVTGIALGAVMALVAISMATGFRAREGAALLVAAGPLGMLEFGVWDVVQRVDRPPAPQRAQQLGIDMSHLEFARVAGAIEVLFGLLLISGALPQAVVIVAGIPFNATLWFFGAGELMGHLPISCTMLVLLVYGSHPELRPAVSAWLPPRRE